MFAAVHDSYWTHACSIDEMSTIIRDTFIALHSSDVLAKLRDEVRSIGCSVQVSILIGLAVRQPLPGLQGPRRSLQDWYLDEAARLL